MSAVPLNETYSICGKTFNLFSKTGVFIEFFLGGRSYKIIRDDIDGGEFFTITSGVNLEKDIDLKLRDRVSIASFGDNYGFFLIYNHRNSQYKYYPEAVDDLFYSFERNWLKDIIINIGLKRISKSFPKSKEFSSILKKVASL